MQNIFVLISCRDSTNPNLLEIVVFICSLLLCCCWYREVAENSFLLLKNIASSTVIVTDTSICRGLSSLHDLILITHLVFWIRISSRLFSRNKTLSVFTKRGKGKGGVEKQKSKQTKQGGAPDNFSGLTEYLYKKKAFKSLDINTLI